MWREVNSLTSRRHHYLKRPWSLPKVSNKLVLLTASEMGLELESELVTELETVSAKVSELESGWVTRTLEELTLRKFHCKSIDTASRYWPRRQGCQLHIYLRLCRKLLGLEWGLGRFFGLRHWILCSSNSSSRYPEIALSLNLSRRYSVDFGPHRFHRWAYLKSNLGHWYRHLDLCSSTVLGKRLS